MAPMPQTSQSFAFTCLLEPWPLDDPILFTDFDRYAEI